MKVDETPHLGHVFRLPVIVAALGYFVDIYDLVLFSIVRVEGSRGTLLAILLFSCCCYPLP